MTLVTVVFKRLYTLSISFPRRSKKKKWSGLNITLSDMEETFEKMVEEKKWVWVVKHPVGLSSRGIFHSF